MLYHISQLKSFKTKRSEIKFPKVKKKRDVSCDRWTYEKADTITQIHTYTYEKMSLKSKEIAQWYMYVCIIIVLILWNIYKPDNKPRDGRMAQILNGP